MGPLPPKIVVRQLNKNGTRDSETLQQTNGATYEAITSILLREWSFYPYPPYTAAHLQPIHTYFIAHYEDSEAPDTEQAASREGATIGSSETGQSAVNTAVANVLGVIGVVWVPLNTYARDHTAASGDVSMLRSVEGYLQVVLVPSEHRRHGVATQLLRHCLELRQTSALGKKAERCSIVRWRLHTMVPSPATLRFSIRQFMEDPPSDDAAEKRCKDLYNHFGSMMHAVIKLYGAFGFVRRRELMRYYLGEADAVEMVKVPSMARKSACRSSQQAAFIAKRYARAEFVVRALQMPAPLPSYTKTKWLAFFAELSAKLTHHNLLVVIEGCELLKRLLTTRISIAAVLQEGELLRTLMDTLLGEVRSERSVGPSVALSEELVLVQLGTLALCVDLLLSLYADGDAYYCALALARAGEMLWGLLEVVQRGHPCFYGLAIHLLARLLQLPVGRGVSVQTDVRALATSSVSLRHHLTELQDSIAKQVPLLQEAVDVLTAVLATTSGPERYAALYAVHLCQGHLHHANKSSPSREGSHSSAAAERAASYMDPDDTPVLDLHSPSRDGLPEDTADLDVSLPHAAPVASHDDSVPPSAHITAEVSESSADNAARTAPAAPAVAKDDGRPSAVPKVPGALFDSTLEQLGSCKSHNAFFRAMSATWCLTVADGARLTERFSPERFASLQRFLLVTPATREDRMLFTALLHWLRHVMTIAWLPSATQNMILHVTCDALVEMLVAELHKGEHPFTDTARWPRSASLAPQDVTNISSIRTPAHANVPRPWSDLASGTLNTTADGTVQSTATALHALSETYLSSHLTASSRVLVESPSLAATIFSFILHVAPACDAAMLDRWLREARVLRVVKAALGRGETLQSPLMDASTTMDSTLSDEVYLTSSLQFVLKDDGTLVVLASKLLQTLLLRYAQTQPNASLPAQSLTFISDAVPQLLRLGVRNPTAIIEGEGEAASALYYAPRSPGASRYTTLGECTLTALDTCLWFGQLTQAPCAQLEDVLRYLPDLLRFTERSTVLPLRATVYHALVYLCRTPSDVRRVVETLPSVMSAAAANVLAYAPQSPASHVAAAASAEWLSAAIDLTSTAEASADEPLPLLPAAFPYQVIEVLAGASINHASAALLNLCMHLAAREACVGAPFGKDAVSVLAPNDQYSVDIWRTLLITATAANEQLVKIVAAAEHSAAHEVGVSAREGVARAASTMENIAAQYSFTGTVLRAVRALLLLAPDFYTFFSSEAIYSAFVAVFTAPPPHAVHSFLSSHFGASTAVTPTLSGAYESMLQWAVELCPVWFRRDHAVQYAALPQAVYNGLCSLMRDERIAQRTRCHLPVFFCGLLVLNGEREGAAIHQSLVRYAAAVFEATLSLQVTSCVRGLQCRLICFFKGANDLAQERSWVAQQVLTLRKLMQLQRKNKGVLSAGDQEAALVALSLITSALSFAECRILAAEVQQMLCIALREGLLCEASRQSTLRALESMTRSSAGRQCLLHEVSTTGETLLRSCFGCALAIALQIPASSLSTLTSSQTTRALTTIYDNRSGGGHSRGPLRDATRHEMMEAGYAVCIAACGRGGAPFVAALLKHRGLDLLNEISARCDETNRDGVPRHLLRLAAVVSLCPEGQRGLSRQARLMTVLIEAAGDATVDGTLALMCVRNLCFLPALKTPLCLDLRVLLTFKAALMGLASVEALVIDPEELDAAANPHRRRRVRCELDTHNTDLMDWAKRVVSRALVRQRAQGKNRKLPAAPRAAASTSKDDEDDKMLTHACAGTNNAEHHRRRVLATSALWALAYDHQRGKAYIKALLADAPAVGVAQLTSLLRESEAASEGPPADEVRLRDSALPLSPLASALENLIFLLGHEKATNPSESLL